MLGFIYTNYIALHDKSILMRFNAQHNSGYFMPVQKKLLEGQLSAELIEVRGFILIFQCNVNAYSTNTKAFSDAEHSNRVSAASHQNNNPLPAIEISTSRPDAVNNIHFSTCMLSTTCFAQHDDSSVCVLQLSAQP